MDDARNDRDFERALERLFAQTPAVDDPDAFARRVEARLSRAWRVRTLAVGGAGVLGGAIAVSQLVASGLGLRVEQVSRSSARAVDAAYQHGFSQLDGLTQLMPSASLFWIASALLILAAVVGATRILDEV